MATTSQLAAHDQRFDASQGPRKLGPNDGKSVDLLSVGVRFMAWTGETGGGFSLVEHPIPPRTLVAPLHKHSREDEYSYVFAGRMGALLGEETVYAETGEFVFKPRDQWHTFWNAGDKPCHILEIISPGGFEHYFDELAAEMAAPDFTPEKIGELGAKYGLEADPTSIPRLCEEYGLRHPLLEGAGVSGIPAPARGPRKTAVRSTTKRNLRARHSGQGPSKF